MARITPTDWRTLVKVFEHHGFRHDRTRGDHLIMVKDGIPRPIVIPKYREIHVRIVQSNLRTAGISREEYLETLDTL